MREFKLSSLHVTVRGSGEDIDQILRPQLLPFGKQGTNLLDLFGRYRLIVRLLREKLLNDDVLQRGHGTLMDAPTVPLPGSYPADAFRAKLDF